MFVIYSPVAGGVFGSPGTGGESLSLVLDLFLSWGYEMVRRQAAETLQRYCRDFRITIHHRRKMSCSLIISSRKITISGAQSGTNVRRRGSTRDELVRNN